MHSLVATALTLTLLLSTAPMAHARIIPAAVPDDPASVVVSIALSAGILPPSEFPVAGRDCDSVLSKLHQSESFAGRIRASYEPPADTGRCFNLEGKKAQVAVVCCAPRPTP